MNYILRRDKLKTNAGHSGWRFFQEFKEPSFVKPGAQSLHFSMPIKLGCTAWRSRARLLLWGGPKMNWLQCNYLRLVGNDTGKQAIMMMVENWLHRRIAARIPLLIFVRSKTAERQLEVVPQGLVKIGIDWRQRSIEIPWVAASDSAKEGKVKDEWRTVEAKFSSKYFWQFSNCENTEENKTLAFVCIWMMSRFLCWKHFDNLWHLIAMRWPDRHSGFVCCYASNCMDYSIGARVVSLGRFGFFFIASRIGR